MATRPALLLAASCDSERLTIHRKTDDKTGFLFPLEGEARIGLVAQVAPVLPAAALKGRHLYSYAVESQKAEDIAPGQRVSIPVGRSGRVVPGFVVSISRKAWDATLRPIDALTDSDLRRCKPTCVRTIWRCDRLEQLCCSVVVTRCVRVRCE